MLFIHRPERNMTRSCWITVHAGGEELETPTPPGSPGPPRQPSSRPASRCDDGVPLACCDEVVINIDILIFPLYSFLR